RLEHSLGTLYIGSQIYDVLAGKHGKYLGRILPISRENDIERFKNTLRFALLLHDVGHAPFSHSSEDLSPKGISHEEMGARVIKAKLEDLFKQTNISRAGIKIDDVVYLIYPEMATETPEEAQIFNLLSSIISGEIDADRIDYLTRDSHHTGVIYGKFDYMRLIDTITFIPYIGETLDGHENFDLVPEIPEPRIGLEYGGIHTVEGLLLARYYMFTQVYFHHIRRIYDLILTDFLKCSLPEGRYPLDVDEYLKYDDAAIQTMIRECSERGSKDEKFFAQKLLYREHPRRVFEEREQLLNFEKFKKEVKEALLSKFKDLNPSDIYVDSASKSAYKPTSDDFSIIKEEISENLDRYWDVKKAWQLKEKSNKKIFNVTECSELLNLLRRVGVEILRVYAKVSKKDVLRAEEVCKEVYDRLREEEERGGLNG
ncbi:MAG: HD domain-containing protein, partial [Archaeoglobaceae archaeon]